MKGQTRHLPFYPPMEGISTVSGKNFRGFYEFSNSLREIHYFFQDLYTEDGNHVRSRFKRERPIQLIGPHGFSAQKQNFDFHFGRWKYRVYKEWIRDTIEIKANKSWERQVIEYYEDLEIICNDYNRTVLRYLGKLNRLLHEKCISQSEYDSLNKSLLKASEALNEVPRTILDLK